MPGEMGFFDAELGSQRVKAFIDEFNAEIGRTAKEKESQSTHALLKRALSDIARKITGIMRAIEDGNYTPTLTKRLSVLQTDKAKAEADLAQLIAFSEPERSKIKGPASVEAGPILSVVADFRRGRPVGAQVRNRCSQHGGPRVAPERPARSR
jgi:hypothetical protein